MPNCTVDDVARNNWLPQCNACPSRRAGTNPSLYVTGDPVTLCLLLYCGPINLGYLG